MPIKEGIKKVLVIGSGPIVIGQAAEFDYAGTQACKALREEGIYVVLVNSNPATIMTDMDMADKVYIEPITIEFVEKIIKKERPDGLLPTLGGQTGLNMAIKLDEAGVLEKYNVQLLGTSLEAIKKAEDREMFKNTMLEIGEPVPESTIANTLEDAQQFVNETGYPVIIRPAYTMGGSGGGIAHNDAELKEIVLRGIKYSMADQVLIERSVAGWKEIEYEVMRDSNDNSIAICNMENIDPIGIHTGDSIVVAPTQTLSAMECHMLHASSIKIIRAIGVEGGCNIQFALDPKSLKYYLIEINPRVSRSSALASKATGYPIAKVSAKIAIGLTLDEIKNPITGQTYACSEPYIDYVVSKVPRWPFDKFALADRRLGTQMKATGEVMSIGRSFESSLLKAIRSLEIGVYGLVLPELAEWSDDVLMKKITVPDDQRLFALAEALRRGAKVEKMVALTGIDLFFVEKLKGIVNMAEEIKKAGIVGLTQSMLSQAKKIGLSDIELAQLLDITEDELRKKRETMGIIPVFKKVDTCAGEFEAVTPYCYSSYEQEDEVKLEERDKALVIGSGPIRIGQGVEFDYCSVHSAWALKDEGMESIIVNNNPETVSTDFDTSDKLYFEPLVVEDVLNIIDKEKPKGVIVQFGGQTAINLAEPLAKHGVEILGTSLDDIDRAEDRERFDELLNELGIPKPAGKTATSSEGALKIARKIGFPVLVRPSYVLGGRAMEIVYDEDELMIYMKTAVKASPKHPVLVDKYLMGKEVEVDAICDGTDVLIPGIMEHIERAGVHSGDSIAVYPTQTLSQKIKDVVVDYTQRLGLALNVKGLINIQYVVYNDNVYVIEVNPRSSRTVPFMSKVTGISMVRVATKVIMGYSLKDQGYSTGLWPQVPAVAVKVPVFSFAKLTEVDTFLGPEMKSTGEVMGLDRDFPQAIYKAMLAAGYNIPDDGTLLATVADKDKAEAIPLLKNFAAVGFKIVATAGTAKVLQEAGMVVEVVNKIGKDDVDGEDIIDVIQKGKIDMVINTLTRGKEPHRDGFRIRRAAVEYNVPSFTSLDTAQVVCNILQSKKENDKVLEPISLDMIGGE